MNRPAQFDRDVIAAYPKLLRYARKHARSADADDCAHEAVAKALIAWEQFEPGTNFGAWLFTICRNVIFNHQRGGKYLTYFADAGADRTIDPRQESLVELKQISARALSLGPWQHEILMLAANGLTMHEMAVAAKLPSTGTAKSRLSRARSALIAMVAA